MNRFKLLFPLLCLLSSVLFGSHAYAVPENLDLLKRELNSYYNSGHYHRDIRTVINHAIRFINSRAQSNRLSQHPQKLAIILDIDETSLSNYNHMVQRQFAATKDQLHNDVIAANAPAIRPTLALYRDAIRQKIAVFFVTGRRTSERQATLKNLKRAGFNYWTGIYFKPEYYRYSSNIPFKTQSRRTITQKGYHIIATIGDQCSDLKGGYAETYFKLPNPFYYLP